MLFSKLTSPPPVPPQEPLASSYLPDSSGGFPNSQSYVGFEEMPPPPPQAQNFMGGYNMAMNPEMGPPPPMHPSNAPGPLDIVEMLNRAAMPIAPPPIDHPPLPHGPSLLNSIFASVVPPVEAPPPPLPSGPLDFLFQSMGNGPPLNQYQSMPPAMSNGPPQQQQPQFFERPFPGPPPHQHPRMPSTFSNPSEQQNFQTMPLDIHSPKPTSAALPQILTTDVIQQLMGLQTSPLISSGSSVSSTGMEQNTSSAGNQQALKPAPFTNSLDKPNPGLLSHPDRSQQPAAVNGDATPRAHSRVVRLLSQNQDENANATSRLENGQTTEELSKLASSHSDPLLESAKITHFPSSSELWPHDQTPWKANQFVEPMSVSGLSGVESQGSEGVLELDFAEVGSLNDIKDFEAKVMSDVPASKRPVVAERASKDEKQKGKQSEKAPVPVSAAPEVKGRGSVSDVKSNGQVKPSSNSSQDFSPELVKTLMVGQLGSVGFTSANRRMEKKEFVREVLTLFHVSVSFPFLSM